MAVALQDLLQKIHDSKLHFALSARGGGITAFFGDRSTIIAEARVDTLDQARDWLARQLQNHTSTGENNASQVNAAR